MGPSTNDVVGKTATLAVLALMAHGTRSKNKAQKMTGTMPDATLLHACSEPHLGGHVFRLHWALFAHLVRFVAQIQTQAAHVVRAMAAFVMPVRKRLLSHPWSQRACPRGRAEEHPCSRS